jgi:hypothetical protein
MWSKTVLLAVSMSVLAVPAARGQSEPRSGLFQITSGRYEGCCGFSPIPNVEPLPRDAQAFVELTIDRQRNVAELRFLGRDMRTVFQKPPDGPQSGFTYAFTNGMVFPDHIQFGELPTPSGSDLVQSYYVVTNSTDTLRIDGWVHLPCPGCSDWLTHFSHVAVLAIAVPTLAIRVSEVEVCWNTTSNRNYQLQFRSALTTNAWTDLGVPVEGNGSTICVANKVPLGQSQRFYRVLTLP